MSRISNFWRRPGRIGVAPSAMTAQELAGWAKASFDAKQYVYRLGFARRVLVARDGLDLETATAALVTAGAPLIYEGRRPPSSASSAPAP